MINIISDFLLQPFNTLAIASTARHFVTVDNEAAIVEAIQVAKTNRWPVRVLGGGSNILCADTVEALVVKNELKGINLVSDNNDSVDVVIAGGENWHETVQYCIQQGWYGLENLSLIPGTVGAAPIQNIGAYGVEIKEFIVSVRVFDLESGTWREFSQAECEFGYRDSMFKQKKNRFIISSVRLRLNKTFKPDLSYGALRHLQGKSLTALHLSQEICRIRQAKLPDPETLPNAGSFFKNPIVSLWQYQQLLQKYPQLVAFDNGDQRKKLAAGWLIDQAGFKGYRNPESQVGTHVEQALVLVNPARKNLANVMAVVEQIQQAVMTLFGVQLEIEPQIMA